jgi:hypothetical protein
MWADICCEKSNVGGERNEKSSSKSARVRQAAGWRGARVKLAFVLSCLVGRGSQDRRYQKKLNSAEELFFRGVQIRGHNLARTSDCCSALTDKTRYFLGTS